MSRIYPILIHKHTPVRYKMSKWKIYTDFYIFDGKPAASIYENGSCEPTLPLATDITRVPVSIKHYADHYMPNNSSVMINPDGTLTKSIKTPSWWERLRGKR